MKAPRPVSASVWAGGRTVANPRISPDGAVLAFVTSSADRAELALKKLDSGTEEWLACEPAIKRVSASGGGVFDWMPDGNAIVYIGVDGCLHLVDLKLNCCRQLSRWPDSLSGVAVSPKGDLVAYAVDMADIAVASTEADGPWPRRLSSGADFVLDPSWSPDGEWVAWHEWDDPHMPWDSSRIVARRGDGSGPVLHVAGGEGMAVQQPRFSPDGKYLSFLSDENGWMNLWAVDGKDLTGKRPLVSDEYEHGGPTWGPGQRTYVWHRGGQAVSICRNERGWGNLVSYDLDKNEVTFATPSTFTGLSAGPQCVVGIATSPTSANRVELVNLETHAATPIARGPLAGIEHAGIEPELVDWRNDSGDTIHGRLYRAEAEGEKVPPLLVWIHGGPTGQSVATLYARIGYFVERGWSVLVPDYRGSTGWGREFMRAMDGQWGIADVEDVASGIRAAGDNGWGDPKRIVAYGGSAGGFTCLLLLAEHPQLCAAGIALYPVTDLLGFGADTWRFEAHYLETLVGQLPSAYATYEQRSPISRAADVKVPLLVLHGDSDIVVPEAQSREFVEKARKAGATVEHHVYAGEGHSWRRKETVIDELVRVENFLRKHVLHLNPSIEEHS